MVKGIMHPMNNGLSNSRELFWICEICGQEFDSSRDWDYKNKISSYDVCKNHEDTCKINNMVR